MAPIPASLKTISPFLTKAEEMKNADPVVAYYCNYWAVQYAITLGVKDPEANVFLGTLLDNLEKTKAKMSTNEAITDDVVGKAHMENFVTNIFSKADEEERSKKATKATASKFLAASIFMEVLRCFGDLDKETSDKIKYAKFQCARILKAFKAGEDPNAGPPEEEEDFVVPIQPYVSPSRTSPPPLPIRGPGIPSPSPQPMNRGPSDQSQQSSTSLPPLIPPRASPDLSRPSFFSPPPPSEAQPLPSSPSITQPPSFTPSTSQPPPVSPSPPNAFSPSLPLNPYSSHTQSPSTQIPPPVPPPRPSQYPISPPAPPDTSSNYYSSPPPAAQPPPFYQPPSNVAPLSNYYTNPAPARPPQPPATQPPASYFPPQPPPQVQIDDEAIAKAQKHARWAISALNYEDVETAVKELRSALNTLGVR